MIIEHFTDNDLYKFTTMNAIQKLYPEAMAKYSFINRGRRSFPEGFAGRLREEVDRMAAIMLGRDEESFLVSRCYYFDPVFIDLLKGYRYNPEEVSIEQNGGDLNVEIKGLWYRTVLWEVPLLAIISELYYSLTGAEPRGVEERAIAKATKLKEIKAEFSDFGTRRRFSLDVHDRVIRTLTGHSGEYFRGTSNVYLAMKYNITPIGTHPHEWFMYHGAHYGYRSATSRALDAWVRVYRGYLGIALSDTYTTSSFFKSFSSFHAKLFDGIRQDSGDPLAFTDRAVEFYRNLRIDPSTKTIVYSDSLNIETIGKIKRYVNSRIHDVYGIGTYLTNDAGAEPLNIVIKLTGSGRRAGEEYHPAVKLSDDTGKYTGDPDEIALCRKILYV